MATDIYYADGMHQILGWFLTLAISACVGGFFYYAVRLLLDWHAGADPYHLRRLWRLSYICFLIGLATTLAWQLTSWISGSVA